MDSKRRVLFHMLNRMLIVTSLLLSLFALSGCLDDTDKNHIQSVQEWTEARLNEPGELLVVRRADLERNHASMTAVLTTSSDDWRNLEALLTLLGVSSAGGVVVTFKKLLKWRSVAWEAIGGMEMSKIGAAPDAYVIDKNRLRMSMSSATAKEIEKIRTRVNTDMVTQATATKLREELSLASLKYNVEPPDPQSTSNGG